MPLFPDFIRIYAQAMVRVPCAKRREAACFSSTRSRLPVQKRCPRSSFRLPLPNPPFLLPTTTCYATTHRPRRPRHPSFRTTPNHAKVAFRTCESWTLHLQNGSYQGLLCVPCRSNRTRSLRPSLLAESHRHLLSVQTPRRIST